MLKTVDRARGLVQALVRKRSQVVFHDHLRTEPVSRRIGLDRGMPIDRYYIDRFLNRHREHLRGRVLEVGEARYAPRFARATATTVLHVADGYGADIVGDFTRPETLPAAAFDTVICTQVLNMIYDLPAAIGGLLHTLAPGGCIAATVSGIVQISRYDHERWGDYWRFTENSLRTLFAPFARAEIASFGNVSAACALLQGVSVEDLPDRSILDVNDPYYPVTLGVLAVKA